MKLCILPAQLSPPNDGITLFATDQPRCWWRVEAGALWSIWVATNHPKPAPVFCVSEKEIVFIGAERAIYALRLNSGATVTCVNDADDVRSFVLAAAGPVLSIAADQVLAFQSEGELMWRQTLHDVVDDLRG